MWHGRQLRIVGAGDTAIFEHVARLVATEWNTIGATVTAGKTTAGTGLMINSARAILDAGKGEDYAAAARQVALVAAKDITLFITLI